MGKKDTDGPWLSALESIELMGCRGFNRDSWCDHFVLVARLQSWLARRKQKYPAHQRTTMCAWRHHRCHGVSDGVSDSLLLVIFCDLVRKPEVAQVLTRSSFSRVSHLYLGVPVGILTRPHLLFELLDS